MSDDNQELLENIIIKFLYTNIEVRERVYPYLKFSLFDLVENVEIIKFVKKFMMKYDKFPSLKETKLKISDPDLFDHLKYVMKIDVSDYSDEVILGEIEEYIREKAMMDVCFKVAEKITNGESDNIKGSPDEMREAMAFSFDKQVGLDIFDKDCEDGIYNHFHNKEYVVSTGLETFDEIIEGGFHEKSLSLFMAETNMGKSLIMGALATNNLLQDKNVLYVTCEMSEHKIGERIIANVFDIETKELKRMSKDKFSDCFAKARERFKGKFIVKEYPTGFASVNHIRNLVKELYLKKKFKPDIIYIDYIGIMAATFRSKSDNTYNIQKRITEEVRGLAVELGIPIISAIQTNRGGFGVDELDLSNVSDSVGTAFTADIMIGVTQPDELRAVGKYRWTLIKNRYGINKVGVTIKVNYGKMRLTDDDRVDDKFGANDDNIKPSIKTDAPKKKDSKEEATPRRRRVVNKRPEKTETKSKVKIQF